MSRDVLAFGEPLLRLQPADADERLEEAARLHSYVGGAELNVAYALSSLGRRSALFGAVPAGPLGRRVLRHLRAGGVDTSLMHERPGRMGLYWTEYGREPRSIEVHYDRAGSAFCTLTHEDAPWAALRESRLFFVSGITPALSPSVRALALEMAAEARRVGVTVAVDLNYRARLWSVAEAAPVLRDLGRAAQLLIAPEADLRLLYGWTGTAEELAARARDEWEVPAVVLTRSGEGAVCVADGLRQSAAVYSCHQLDRVGAGDAFTAGLLHAWLDGRRERALDYALAMAALKHSVRGDTLITSAEELERVAARESREIRR